MELKVSLKDFNELIQRADFKSLNDLINIRIIDADTKFADLIQELQTVERVGLDVEGSSLDPHTSTLLLIQISTQNNVYVINYGKVSKQIVNYLFQLIEDRGIECIGHNIKFDTKVILNNTGILLKHLFDTQIAETISLAGINDPYSGYAGLVEKYIGVILNKDTRKDFIEKTDFEFTDNQIIYAGLDVIFLLPLRSILLKLIEDRGQLKTWELETKLEPVVAKMEYDGVLLDRGLWTNLAISAQTSLDETVMNIRKFIADNFDTIIGDFKHAWDAFDKLSIPFWNNKSTKALIRRKELSEIVVRDDIISNTVQEININSHKQVPIILNSLGIPVQSSSQKDLEGYKDHELVKLILDFRKYEKRIDSFGLDFLDHINLVTGRVHATFDQARGATGRFGSSNPNLQNIIADEEYRGAFISRKGYLLLTADYQQIELKTMAEVSREQVMLDAFIKGEDLHALTASIIMDKAIADITKEERDDGKTLNFSVIYGTSEYGLRRQLGWPLEKGQLYLERYFDTYQKIREFIEYAGSEVFRRGYSITMLGRKRFFAIPNSLSFKNYQHRAVIDKIKRQGVNHIVQGTCGDMLKIAMIQMYYDNPFDQEAFRLLKTVHDEIVVEIREDIKVEADEFVRKCMISAGEVFLKIVPVTVKVIPDICWRK